MKRWIPTLPQIGFILLAGFFLFCSSKFLTIVNEKRVEYNLTQNEIEKNAPPEVVLATTVLGGLRGFIIDYLWLRVVELRNQGNHFEVIQLYNWIGKLEPHIPAIWRLTAAEMAYNIPVTLSDKEDKWRWTYKGIEHLRDNGIQYNQDTAQLYQELGFLIFDKLELNSNDAYKVYYQKCWFDIWNELIDDKTDFAELEKAPIKFKECQNNGNWNKFLQFLANASIAFSMHWTFQEFPKTVPEQVANNQEMLNIWNLYRSYLIYNRITKDLKMDLGRIQKINEKYGTLDWRLPPSHSFYWGEIAFEKMKDYRKKMYTSSLFTHVQILRYNSLRQSFENGRFLANTPLQLVTVPNFSLIDSLNDTFLEVQAIIEELGKENYRDFLEHVVKTCYLYNQKEKSAKYYSILRKKFPEYHYDEDIDVFAVKEIGKVVNWGKRQTVEDYIMRVHIEAYQALLNGVTEHYEGLSRFGKVMHNQYMKRHEDMGILVDVERPQPLRYFQQHAIQWIVQELQRRLGKEKAEEIWSKVIKVYPILDMPVSKNAVEEKAN